MHTKKTGFGIAVVLLLLSLISTTSFALNSVGLFELDRNAIDDDMGPAPGDDWDTLYGGGGSAGDFTGIIADVAPMNPLGTTGTQFQAGGSKDDLDIGPAGVTGQYWKWEPGEPLDKDDITNAYAAAYINPADNGDNKAGDLIIYFGLDRFANNGSAQVGFWFLQNEIGLTNISDGGGYQFSGVHQVGDILVQSNFSRGGVIDTISIYEWVGSGGDNGTLDLVLTAQDCTTAHGQTACATVNQDDTTAPWPFVPKFGTSGIFPQGSFFEGGINVTQLVPDAGCFTGFLAETRSSTPFDSRLKDFALGDFQLCDANIQIEPDDVNEVGQDHTFTVTVNQVYAGVSSPAADGTIVTVELTDANGAVSNITSDTCANPGTVDGECSVTFSSDSAGTVTGHASATVTILGDDFYVETDGSGDNSDDAVKTYVDAYITIEPDDTNEVGDAHTFTVTVYQDDGSGSGFLPAAGEDVDFTLTDSNGAASLLDAASSTCDDAGNNTDASGQCTIVFTSNSAGQVTGHASSDVQVGGLSLSRSTDGAAPNSDDAVKTFIDGSLAWLKHDEDGNLLGGATFEVCRTHDRFGNDIADECVSVLDNSAPDLDPDAGEFLLDALFLGRYTITETAPPAGYVGDPFVETLELTLAAPDQSATHIWVNTLPMQGCTPGFWQGGAGSQLWDQANDPQWIYNGTNPFIHTTLFNDYFNDAGDINGNGLVDVDSRLAGLTMYDLVGSGGTSDSARRAARDMVAAYLNESAFPNDFPALSLLDLKIMWYDAVAGGDAALDAFHVQVSGWNNPEAPGFCPLP